MDIIAALDKHFSDLQKQINAYWKDNQKMKIAIFERAFGVVEFVAAQNPKQENEIITLWNEKWKEIFETIAYGG